MLQMCEKRFVVLRAKFWCSKRQCLFEEQLKNSDALTRATQKMASSYRRQCRISLREPLQRTRPQQQVELSRASHSWKFAVLSGVRFLLKTPRDKYSKFAAIPGLAAGSAISTRCDPCVTCCTLFTLTAGVEKSPLPQKKRSGQEAVSRLFAYV